MCRSWDGIGILDRVPATSLTYNAYTDGTIAGLRLRELHLPSERVAFEMVVRFLIAEMGVIPLRTDWAELIEEALAMFVKFRTWPRSHPIDSSN